MELIIEKGPIAVFKTSGETPAKKNSKIFNSKTHRAFPSKRFRIWHESAYMELKKQYNRQDTLDHDTQLFFIFTFNHSDNIRRDGDNGTASIFDLLQDCGIITDDRWQIARNFLVLNNKLPKGTEAFCEIQIYDYEDFALTIKEK